MTACNRNCFYCLYVNEKNNDCSSKQQQQKKSCHYLLFSDTAVIGSVSIFNHRLFQMMQLFWV